MLSYPYRTEAQEAALARLPATAYSELDNAFPVHRKVQSFAGF